MHEASLVAGLMRRIEDAARAAGARRVVGVAVSLGALSHASADHLREHFERAAAGTLAAGAALEVEVGADPDDPRAQEIVLESVEVED